MDTTQVLSSSEVLLIVMCVISILFIAVFMVVNKKFYDNKNRFEETIDRIQKENANGFKK